ncbi:MAG TPA: alpha/beta hydrolase, partial [Polyangiaceae bacterium]|nr:alpha/beta hydrolase [Polyangiaceae bacterium]
AVRPYLDRRRFTWVFADLRGYGRSKGQRGDFTLREAASDVVALAEAIGFARAAVVGHSMSSLVALHLAQHHAGLFERAVLLTPPPPRGFGSDGAGLEAMRALALGDDEARERALRAMWGGRLSEPWVRFKLRRWRETADPEAVAAYVAMFARDGLPEPDAPVDVPLLAITGEKDAEPMRHDAVKAALAPLAGRLSVVPLAESGHYPMQEAPPLLATLVGRFLSGEG